MNRVVSFGGGVQTAALCLMAAHGEIGPMPVAAYFADTQRESAETYAYIDWIEKKLPFPVIRTSHGDLWKSAATVRVSKSGEKYVKTAIPAHWKGGGVDGLGKRQCTFDYKIAVVRREIKKLREPVVMWIGISRDEAHRAKPSRVGYITNEFPLLERGITRGHCLEWLEKNGYPIPPRSACIFCPYRSNAAWRSLPQDEFDAAVEFERQMQAAYAETGRFDGVPFLHPDRVPLEQADITADQRQVSLFGNECFGMCGV